MNTNNILEFLENYKKLDELCRQILSSDRGVSEYIDEDIEWLHTFYCRIMECTDPFSLLHQSENINKKAVKQEKCPEITISTNKVTHSRNGDLSDKAIILASMILAGLILMGIVVFGILFSVF